MEIGSKLRVKVFLRMSKKKKKWALIGAGVFVVLILFFSLRSPSTTIVYHDYQVKSSSLEITIQTTGIVQPENRLEIKPPIAGRVETVLVKEGQFVHKDEVLAWLSSTERAALLDAARAEGEAEVKRWEDLYKATPIIAPISGTIILRNVESGQTFANTESVFTMSDRLTVKAQVDETDIAQVKLSQKARITLDAYPNENIDAHVDKIAFDAKTYNSVTTYDVDVLPEVTPPAMRSGMTANVTFLVTVKSDVLKIPNEALKMQDGNLMVLVKGESGRIPTIVQLGLNDGKTSEVVSGLKENDTILIPEAKTKLSKQNSNPFLPAAH